MLCRRLNDAHRFARFDGSIRCLLQMRLIVLSEMGFLSERFATQTACKWLLAGVRPYVHIHRILIFEAFRTDRAVMQRTFLPDASRVRSRSIGEAVHAISRHHSAIRGRRRRC